MIFEKLFRLFHWDNIVTRSVADFSVRALCPASQPMNLCNVNSKFTSALGGEGKPPTKHRAADAASHSRLQMLCNNSGLSISDSSSKSK